MNMYWFDWTIVAALLAIMVIMSLYTKKYTRSVADFLAANRCANRYILGVSEGIAAVGGITIVAIFEAHYKAGFSIAWWGLITLIASIVISLSGWVVYRFRQTRALTLAQFFEMRYNKNFRIFTGILAFLSGIINFGIFPAVGGRFFMYFCGLPETFLFLGFNISTFMMIIIVILATSLFFIFIGGQISIIVTDFIQGTFFNVVWVTTAIVLLLKFPWSQISQALSMAPKDASLLHPFHTGNAKDFNFWFYLISAFGAIYTYMAWQGSQAFNSCAKNAHEARMGKVIGSWRILTQALLIIILPICAYTLMHHPAWNSEAERVKAILAGIDNGTIREQMTVPIALSHILPAGLLGAFVAAMLAAEISTDDAYLHSWGSIFIQDVVMPFSRKVLTRQQHMRLLRWSIIGVAVFIFLFSMLFRQTQYIFMFFALTGTIWLGGAGTVIIGGLYWKRGTTAAAWSAMIAGSSLGVGGIILEQAWPRLHGGEKFPVNGQYLWFIAMISSLLIYVIVSLLDRKSVFDLDKMLHHGKYAVADDKTTVNIEPVKGFVALLGIGEDFTRKDKIVYSAMIGWTFLWAVVFVVGTTYNLIFDVKTESWTGFWHFYVVLSLVVGVITTLWLTIGGLFDLKKMFQRLRIITRNDNDDGRVITDETLSANAETEPSHTESQSKMRETVK